nr:uncharacterized protein LOC124815998 [Hydra vulgaris]
MANSDTLNITENPIIDESIEKFEYHEYSPKIANFDNPGTEISITINEESLFTLPSEAYILIEGRLLKADGTSYANADAVTLINNGLMYLFTRAEYQLSGQTVENVNCLGRATTMLGLLKYPNYFQNVQGMNQLWFRDSSTTAAIATNLGFQARQSYLIQEPNTKGKFSFCVPLKHIFGFCDTYDKVVFGLKHTLILIRESDNNAIFRAAGTAAGQVNLTKVSLFMPHVKPSLEYDLKLKNIIKSNKTLPLSYIGRQCELKNVDSVTDFSWTLNMTSTSTKPRFIIIGFQTNKNNSQEQNPAIFDHCDIKDMCIKLNSRSYPEIVNYNLSFPNQQFSRAYRDATLFNEKLYGLNELISQCNINPQDYKNLYPLFVFDVSNQPEATKPSVIDVQFNATFNTAVPANTMAYAVILSDRIGQLSADGSKLQYIF